MRGRLPALRPHPFLLETAVAISTIGSIFACASPLPAQPAELPAREQAQQVPAELPGPLELTARYRSLADSAAYAEREAERMARVDALSSELQALRRRQAELDDLLATITVAEYVRPERISRVRDQALAQDQQLAALLQRAGERLDYLGALRAEWTHRQRTWSAWREAARDEPEYRLVGPELQQALARIDTVQGRITEAMPYLLAIQREIGEAQAANSRIIERTGAIRAGRREALTRRAEPVLISRAYTTQLQGALGEEWRPLAAVQVGAFAAFLRDNAQLVLLHLLLALGLGLIARRVRRPAEREGAWSGMLLHPWAVGLFTATAIVGWLYELPPPLWDVIIWTLLAGSGAVLATRLIAARPLRLLVYFFASFYPLFLLAEATQVPAPVFRLGLTVGASIGVALFGALAWRASRADDPRQRRLRWPLGAAAAIWTVVAGAELLGFYLLARWILHATVTSALIVFVVGFLVTLARGALRTLLRMEARGHMRFLRRAGVPLAERLVLLLQAALVVGAGLTLLDIWEIAPSPAETWSRIAGAGVTIAGVEITIGRILFAFIVVYLAVLASWLIRTFVDSEARHRWGVDEAVGNSIKMLLHYSLILLGILFALGVLGVELQNFVIVAGALGVGIGFGLQNIVNNFVSGLILLFERPVRVGDTVVMDGEWGTIKKIGLRSTIVLTFDRSELIVPNADLVSEKVTNWTLSNPMARLIIPVGVAYGSDVTRVLAVLREASRVHPAALEDPEPQVLFVGFGDSSLDFELRVWVTEIRHRLEVRSAVLAEVDRRFREEGIEIPFPQRDLHLRSVDRAIADSILPGGDAREREQRAGSGPPVPASPAKPEDGGEERA